MTKHTTTAYIAIAIATAIASIQPGNGFLFQPSTRTPCAVNQKIGAASRSGRCSGSSSSSSIGAMAIPFFTNQTTPEPVLAVEVQEEDDDSEASQLPGLLKLASMHCASQALNTAVKLRIPDILGLQTMSVEELAEAIEATSYEEDDEDDGPCNRDALLRTMRLLTTVDVVRETTAIESAASSSSSSSSMSMSMSMESSFRFSLTPLGKSLRTHTTPEEEQKQSPSLASVVKHWMEEPLWDSWLELPDYIREGGHEDPDLTLLPFERANGAVSSDDYYNEEDHPDSLKNANDFVRLVHDAELEAVLKGFDWSEYQHQRLVDVAGNNGKLAEAIAAHEPTLDCSCLDLPSVIKGCEAKAPENVKLVPGNVLDPDTIPDCEVLLMKHFCDRSMWFDDQTVEILRSCKTVLQRSSKNFNDNNNNSNGNGNGENTSTITRRLVIADAVLPDCGDIHPENELPLYLDAMYMLVGRERQRTRSEWKALAEAAGLRLTKVIYTDVPSCSLIVLEPISDNLSP